MYKQFQDIILDLKHINRFKKKKYRKKIKSYLNQDRFRKKLKSTKRVNTSTTAPIQREFSQLIWNVSIENLEEGFRKLR